MPKAYPYCSLNAVRSFLICLSVIRLICILAFGSATDVVAHGLGMVVDGFLRFLGGADTGVALRFLS